MRISDWSSDVCSSDLTRAVRPSRLPGATIAPSGTEATSASSVSRPNIRGGGSLIQTRTLTRSISPLSTTSLFDASLTRPPPARGPKEYQLQCIVTSPAALAVGSFRLPAEALLFIAARLAVTGLVAPFTRLGTRSEEHTSELQSLMRISYAVFCLKKKKDNKDQQTQGTYHIR